MFIEKKKKRGKRRRTNLKDRPKRGDRGKERRGPDLPLPRKRGKETIFLFFEEKVAPRGETSGHNRKKRGKSLTAQRGKVCQGRRKKNPPGPSNNREKKKTKKKKGKKRRQKAPSLQNKPCGGNKKAHFEEKKSVVFSTEKRLSEGKKERGPGILRIHDEKKKRPVASVGQRGRKNRTAALSQKAPV